MRKGIKRSPQISFIPLAIIVGLLLVFAGKTVAATMKDNRVLGKVIYLAKGEDGGGDDNGSSGKGSSGNSESSGSSNSGSSDGSNSGSGPSSSGSSTRQATPSQRPERIEPTEAPETEVETENEVEDEAESEAENEEATPSSRIETKPEETRTEVRLSETERIRTRTKDGRTRIDITSGGIKTRLEIRDDRVVVKAEQEDGTEVELENDTLFKIDDRLAKDNIKVATAGAEQFLLQKGTTGAVTDFPVSVDLATNTVFINTPSGQRTITVLPEQAIQNLIAVYEINGISNQKLLGFIPVLIQKEVTVSAETGNALSINESLSARILDAISF